MKKKIIATILSIAMIITPTISSYATISSDELVAFNKEWVEKLNIPLDAEIREMYNGLEFSFGYGHTLEADENGENLIIDGSKYGEVDSMSLRKKYPNAKSLTITDGFYLVKGISSNTLETISLPESVVRIGNLDALPALKSINIPSKVKDISTEAFRSCYDLESIDLNNIQFIGVRAFEHCESLKSVKMDNAVCIGENAFMYCDSLEEVHLPDTLEYIDLNAFDRNIKRFFVTKGSYAEQWCIEHSKPFVNGIDEDGNFAAYRSYFQHPTDSYSEYLNDIHYIFDEAVDGIVYNEDKTEILDYDAYKKDKEFTIPKGVKKATIKNDYLEKLTLNDEIEFFSDYAFNLNNIYIPNDFDYDTFNSHKSTGNKFYKDQTLHFSVKSKMFTSVFGKSYEEYIEDISNGITTYNAIKNLIDIRSNNNNYDVYDVELLDVEVKSEPTAIPTTEPTVEPTVTPTEEPTTVPTATPTAEPTATPTVEPTITPTVEPTEEPTAEPTVEPIPIVTPTTDPTVEPTVTPTEEPSAEPTVEPTVTPTEEPSAKPTVEPTVEPTVTPTEEPTPVPAVIPVVCGTFADKVNISINSVTLNSDETGLEILIDTLSNDIDISKVTVYGAVYDENGNLVSISVFDNDGNAFIGSIAHCKLMIWYDGLQPMINSLTI